MRADHTMWPGVFRYISRSNGSFSRLCYHEGTKSTKRTRFGKKHPGMAEPTWVHGGRPQAVVSLGMRRALTPRVSWRVACKPGAVRVIRSITGFLVQSDARDGCRRELHSKTESISENYASHLVRGPHRTCESSPAALPVENGALTAAITPMSQKTDRFFATSGRNPAANPVRPSHVEDRRDLPAR